MQREFHPCSDEHGGSYFVSVMSLDVTETHYARDFSPVRSWRERQKRPNMTTDPVGAFHIVATAAGVEIRRAMIRTVDDLNVMHDALDLAYERHLELCLGPSLMIDPNDNETNNAYLWQDVLAETMEDLRADLDAMPDEADDPDESALPDPPDEFL